VLEVSTIEMRILLRDALDKFRLDHGGSRPRNLTESLQSQQRAPSTNSTNAETLGERMPP
jgi:hypothetical protein